jgi:hypothetical protein
MTLAPVYHPAPAPPAPGGRLEVAAYAVADADPPHEEGPPTRRHVRPLPPHRHQPVLRLVTAPDGGPGGGTTVGTGRDDLDDPLPRAGLLTRALLEVISGIRPAGQLAPWVSPAVLATLHRMVAGRITRPAPAALRRVLVSEPVPGVAEVTAVVQRGVRAEALALRMEAVDGRWIVTALQRP